MKKLVINPGWVFAIFIVIYLFVGIFIVRDFGFSTDERIEKTRASIALSKYGMDVGFLRDDYEDIGHSQFYGTATTMLILWLDNLLSPRMNLSPGVVMHFGYFLSFVIAIIAIYYLIKLFANQWIALLITILFATQPLLFGQAFMNPKDIPLLAVFILTITIGFYIDRHKRWKHGVAIEIDLTDLTSHWRQFLVSLPRKTYISLLILFATLALIFLLKPVLINILSQIITTAYTDPYSIWGSILTRFAENLISTPLDAYINKGVANMVRVFNAASTLVILGLIAIAITIISKGYRELPKTLQDKSVLHSLSIHLKNPLLIIGGLVFGFAISTRIVSIFAGGIVILYLLWVYRKKAILPLLIYTGFSALFAYLSWPIFWRYGPSAIFQALDLFSDFDPYSGSILFMGEILKQHEIPWNYLPHLITVQFTEPLVIISMLGLCIWTISLFLDRSWSNQRKKLLLVFLWFVLPFAYVVIVTPIMYNNFRQFIFISPPLFVFAAYAIQSIDNYIHNRVILPLVVALALVPGILNLYSLHPYQYIYYNQFVGGVQGAYRDYELDYWYISMKEAIEYINSKAQQNANILVWDVEYPQALLYKRSDININRVAHIAEADYPVYQFAVIPTIRNADHRVPASWIPIHTVSRAGADLVIIYELDRE